MKEYDITQQMDVKHAGSSDDFDFVNRDFTETPSRLMSAVLDMGTMPTGADAKAQLSR